VIGSSGDSRNQKMTGFSMVVDETPVLTEPFLQVFNANNIKQKRLHLFFNRLGRPPLGTTSPLQHNPY
jgi:hypothetical protein